LDQTHFHFEEERQKANGNLSEDPKITDIHTYLLYKKYHPKIPRSQIPRLVSSTCLLGYWSPWDEVGGAGWCPGSQDPKSFPSFSGIFSIQKKVTSQKAVLKKNLPV